MSSPKLRLDLTALTASARAKATTELTNEASRRLSKAIFGEKKEAEEGVPEEPAAPGELDRDAAEDLLNKGLGKLFGN